MGVMVYRRHRMLVERLGDGRMHARVRMRLLHWVRGRIDVDMLRGRLALCGQKCFSRHVSYVKRRCVRRNRASVNVPLRDKGSRPLVLGPQ